MTCPIGPGQATAAPPPDILRINVWAPPGIGQWRSRRPSQDGILFQDELQGSYRAPNKSIWIKKLISWHLCTFSEELHKNGRYQQLPRHFLLQIDLFGARYDPWSSSWDGVPSWDGLRERHWPAPGRSSRGGVMAPLSTFLCMYIPIFQIKRK